jgi:hypothetical protein
MSAELTVCDEAGNRLDMQYFIVRPAVYCAMCNSPVVEEVLTSDLTARNVWCANRHCAQHGKRIRFRDPVASGSTLPTAQ